MPKYQPGPVQRINGIYTFPTIPDSTNTQVTSGFTARMRVFVDSSNGNGVYDSATGNREAMRSFVYSFAGGSRPAARGYDSDRGSGIPPSRKAPSSRTAPSGIVNLGEL